MILLKLQVSHGSLFSLGVFTVTQQVATTLVDGMILRARETLRITCSDAILGEFHLLLISFFMKNISLSCLTGRD